MDWSEEKEHRGKDRERSRRKDEKDKSRDHDRERHRRDRDRVRDKDKPSSREKPRDKESERRDRAKGKDRDHEKGRDRDKEVDSSELEHRILKMKEERTKRKAEEAPPMSSWLNKIRKIESDKQKALHKSKLLEEQDNIVQGDSDDDDDDEPDQHHNLAGVKVLHGFDKVIEGGAVVLTLKDQNILAGGDLNEDVDMLENVEIGEQKRRDDAYKAGKKTSQKYDDKFNDDPYSEKKILPQYDDPNTDEGITLDERGRIAGEAEKRLEELRKRLDGVSPNTRVEDLNIPGKISSDYYTREEMLQFKKPKKKKALRKKDKLDLDALEAEAISAGLGVGDLGSRNNARSQAIMEELDRSEAERKDKARQAAYAKADEASKSLRIEQPLPVQLKEEEYMVFADDADDLHKSLERARKIALKKKEEDGAVAVARLATTTAAIASNETVDEHDSESEAVVETETKQFVISLQLGKAAVLKRDAEDVLMEEDDEPIVSDEEDGEDEPSGPIEVNDIDMEENHPSNELEEEIVPDEIIHEVAVGKGLASALKLLQERGSLKETVNWGGRNMDKKKSKLVGIVNDDDADEPPKKNQHQTHHRDSKDFVYHEKDIRIERTDEFGRIMTPKEAFRTLSHKFHGKGPGKMKQEKRMKQYQEEVKLKKMKSSDTPSMSVERMREAQAQLKSPYIVLSGNMKPGQTSDPRSGYATVERDLPGGMTPMLGDRKVEHFLGIERKPEPSNSEPSQKPKQ